MTAATDSRSQTSALRSSLRRAIVRILLAGLTGGIVALALIGCSRGAEPEPTATPAPTPTPVNPADVLLRSGEAMAELSAFRFALEHEGDGGTPLSESLTVTEAEGAVVSPDKLTVEFSGVLGTFAIRSGFITIGDESYMTNPLTGEWEPVAREVSPIGFFDPQRGIASIMAQVERPSLASHSDGKYVIDGTLPVSALAPLLGSAAQGDTVSVRLTIDVATLRLERAVIEGRVTAFEEDGVARVIRLWGFDERVEIERPEGN